MLNSIYGEQPTDKMLNIVKSLKLKGYTLKKTQDCFFIWEAEKPKHSYIRLTLIRHGFNDNTKWYWNLEIDFRPFKYKHNHRDGANEQSPEFTSNEEDKYFNFFLNMIDRIKSMRG